MKIYGKYLSIAFIFGNVLSLYGSLQIVGISKATFLSALASDIGFGEPGGLCMESCIKLMSRSMPFIIYVIIFTTYIYRHYCFCSVYIFSRCKHRIYWFLKEAGKLYLFSNAYVGVFVLGRILPILVCGRLICDTLGMIMLFHFWGVMSVWLFQITLLANILSMKWGSQIGATAVCVIHAISVISLTGIDEKHLFGMEAIKFQCNISAHLVTGWHRIKGYDSEFLSMLNFSLNYRDTYIYIITLSILWIIIGIFFVERTDIIQQNKEI